MEIAYFVIGGLLLIVSLFVMGGFIWYYFDEYRENDLVGNADRAKKALWSLTLPLLVVLWPFTVPIAIIGGVAWLVHTLRKSAKGVDTRNAA